MKPLCILITMAIALQCLSACGTATIAVLRTPSESARANPLEESHSALTEPPELTRVIATPTAPHEQKQNLAADSQLVHEANFGKGDPSVTVIAADPGGNINFYENNFFGPQSVNRRWAVDGYCNSACTMVMGTGRVCATPRAQFGFHAGHILFFRWKVAQSQATNQMYRRYPDNVKSWVNAHHAMDRITMTMMRQPEVAAYVPSCKSTSRKQ